MTRVSSTIIDDRRALARIAWFVAWACVVGACGGDANTRPADDAAVVADLEADAALEPEAVGGDDAETGDDVGDVDDATTAGDGDAGLQDTEVPQDADPGDDATDATTPDTDDADDADDADDIADITHVPDSADSTITPDSAGPTACSPPLDFVQAEAWVLARTFLSLEATGGTGAYRFRFGERRSGAVLDPYTGEYVSGATRGVVDLVVVEDSGCLGQALAEVHVVFPMAVTPRAATVQPGTSFTPLVLLGSGVWRIALAAGGTTGARIENDGTRFVAGPVEGDETVIVQDIRSGETVAIPIIVRRDAGPAFDPPTLFGPPGATYPSLWRGGTGTFSEPSASDDGDGVHFVASPSAMWRFDGMGSGVATIGEVLLGATVSQRAQAITAVGAEATPSGHSLDLWAALAPGDIDGDGFDDIIAGSGEMHAGAFQSGVVFIWAGAENAPDPAPRRVLGGAARGENFGAALAAGDFDGDGRIDLAVAAARAPGLATNVGRASVHAGVDGAFFGDQPVWNGTGARSGDLFGHALAACDFDADGFDDLAVGAMDAEDPAILPAVSNHGGVWLYRGGPAGLGAEPAQVVFGFVPGADGAWVREANLRFGRTLAAGDVDGDGACDLVVANHEIGNDNGVVWVHRGVRADSGAGGPIAASPVAVWRGSGGARFGFSVAVGDLDGDGVGDIAIGEPRRSTSATASESHGVVRIVRGGAWAAGGTAANANAVPFDTTVANPGTTSSDNNDEFGFRVAIGDVTGDGLADLNVGGVVDEGTCTGRTISSGAVWVFSGRAGLTPNPSATAVMGSVASSDRLGLAIAAVGRVDGTPHRGLFAIAGREDSRGPDLGLAMVFRPLVPATGICAERVLLDMPAIPGGWRSGQGFAVVPDLDGDGWPELAVGAPEGAGLSAGGALVAQSGLVTLHRGAPGGFAATPFQVLNGFRRHSNGDRWGADIATLDDFDGDGRVDLAIVAPGEDAVTSYGAGTTSAAVCNVARTNTGATAIFRSNDLGTFETEPMLMHFGNQVSQLVERALGLDFNGDGRTDLVTSGRAWDRAGLGSGDNAGGIDIVLGRSRAHPTDTVIQCEADHRAFGSVASDDLGTSLANLGDLDGDGCEDLVVGVPGADQGTPNAGGIEIFFGAGTLCSTIMPRRLLIVARDNLARVGSTIATGDIDGDGLMDLAVAGTGYRLGGVAVGAVWLLRGAVLAQHAALAVERADHEAPVVVWLDGVNGLGATRVTGTRAGEGFGVSVALLPGAVGDGDGPLAGPQLAVGSLDSAAGDVATGGIVRLFPLSVANGRIEVAAFASAVVAAEPANGLGPTLLGHATDTPAGRFLLVGTPESSLVQAFSGAVQIVPIDGEPTILEDMPQ